MNNIAEPIRMTHTSGPYQLRKITKTQVRATIRKTGRFHGFLCGNKVNSAHIADGWHLGAEVDIDNLDEFEKEVEDFETDLILYTPDLGTYPHYYQIIKS